MKQVYRIEGTVAVTFYVRAESEERAVAKAYGYVNDEPPLTSGVRFDSKYLPEVSISPAMTVLSIEASSIECVEALDSPRGFSNTTKETTS